VKGQNKVVTACSNQYPIRYNIICLKLMFSNSKINKQLLFGFATNNIE
jgi:hypothetical protein